LTEMVIARDFGAQHCELERLPVKRVQDLPRVKQAIVNPVLTIPRRVVSLSLLSEYVRV
jgi:hypothetical protein